MYYSYKYALTALIGDKTRKIKLHSQILYPLGCAVADYEPNNYLYRLCSTKLSICEQTNLQFFSFVKSFLIRIRISEVAFAGIILALDIYSVKYSAFLLSLVLSPVYDRACGPSDKSTVLVLWM